MQNTNLIKKVESNNMRKIATNYFYELIIKSNGKFILSDEQEYEYEDNMKNVLILKDNTGDVVDLFYPNKHNQINISNEVLFSLYRSSKD